MRILGVSYMLNHCTWQVVESAYLYIVAYKGLTGQQQLHMQALDISPHGIRMSNFGENRLIAARYILQPVARLVGTLHLQICNIELHKLRQHHQ